MVLLMIAGCKDALQVTPQGPPVGATYWKNKSDVVSAYNSMFTPIQTYEEFYGRGYMWYIDAGPDMVVGRDNSAASNIKNFNSGAATASYVQNQWKFRYFVIRRAMEIEEHVPEMDLDPKFKNRMIGSAYFMEGLMYFELTYVYGGVPIVKDNDFKNNDFDIPRAKNKKIVYNYAAGLLKKAAKLLPFFKDLDPSVYGSPHKVAAWGYLAKLYLYDKKYKESEAYADSIINHSNRHLLPNFKDVFTIAENWGPQYIWSVVSSTQGGSELPGVMLENKGWGKYNGWGYFQPTKELYDLYPPKDKRRAVTILAPGNKFKYFGKVMTYHSSTSETGYQFNKYMEPFGYPNLEHVNPNGNFPTTDLNVPLMRYAGIILIKAEDRLMQGENADQWINMIRNRAGLPSIHNTTMKNLKKERRLELAGEYANTYRDIVRWGNYKLLDEPLHGVNGKVVWPARHFDPSYMKVWPIPQSVIDNSGGVIKQNPGW